MSDGTTPGALRATDQASHTNALGFFVGLMMGKAAHVYLGRVESCTSAGQIAPAGTVDVTPMVVQVDANGNAVPGSKVHGLSYFRLQAGMTAIIADPVPGDIGLVCVCDRDISSAKANQAPSNPGSARQFNEADGIFIGGVLNGLLNGTPTQYLQAVAATGGWNLVTPGPFTVQANNMTIDANGNAHFNGEVIRGFGGSDQVTLGHHHHPVPASGNIVLDPIAGT